MKTTHSVNHPAAVKLTLASVRATLRPAGVSLTSRDGEFRVRLVGSPAGHGYFTNDLGDALATGLYMAREHASRMAFRAESAAHPERYNEGSATSANGMFTAP